MEHIVSAIAKGYTLLLLLIYDSVEGLVTVPLIVEFSLFSRLRANDALNYFNNVFSAGRECCQGFFFARGGFPIFIYNTSMRLRRSFTYIIVRSGYLAFCVPHTALLFVHCPDSVAKKQRTTTGRWLLAI